MQVQTSEGIILTLTEEQIQEIDRQVKAKLVPQSIMDRVKSWEDAFHMCNPIYWVSAGDGSVNTSLQGNTWDSAGHVTSAKRAKSVLAYCQLSVISDALNEEWVADWNDGNQVKVYVEWLHDSKRFGIDGCYSHNVHAIFFRSYELAKYTVEQFPDLWKEYFMIG